MTITRIALTDTSEQTLVSAPTTPQRIRVYCLSGSNAGASLSRADIKESTTVKWSFAMAADGGGFVLPIPANQWWDLPAATALKVQQSAAVTSYVTVGYEVI